jgi:hypothetical protein
MKKRYSLLITGFVGFVFLFVVAGIYAGSAVPDVIEMNNKAYAKHTKGIVKFSHKKHSSEYKAGCGECHHDANNKPLNNVKAGDNVQGCIECHKKPGKKLKTKKGEPKLTKKQRLEYHSEAIHYNCKGCHKDINKKTKTKKAPTTCSKCHPKK